MNRRTVQFDHVVFSRCARCADSFRRSGRHRDQGSSQAGVRREPLPSRRGRATVLGVRRHAAGGIGVSLPPHRHHPQGGSHAGHGSVERRVCRSLTATKGVGTGVVLRRPLHGCGPSFRRVVRPSRVRRCRAAHGSGCGSPPGCECSMALPAGVRNDSASSRVFTVLCFAANGDDAVGDQLLDEHVLGRLAVRCRSPSIRRTGCRSRIRRRGW